MFFLYCSLFLLLFCRSFSLSLWAHASLYKRYVHLNNLNSPPSTHTDCPLAFATQFSQRIHTTYTSTDQQKSLKETAGVFFFFTNLRRYARFACSCFAGQRALRRAQIARRGSTNLAVLQVASFSLLALHTCFSGLTHLRLLQRCKQEVPLRLRAPTSLY